LLLLLQALQLDLSGASVAYYSLPALAVLVSHADVSSALPANLLLGFVLVELLFALSATSYAKEHAALPLLQESSQLAAAMSAELPFTLHECACACCLSLVNLLCVVRCRVCAWLCCKVGCSTWRACFLPSTSRWGCSGCCGGDLLLCSLQNAAA
jgi:hypothetical protein